MSKYTIYCPDHKLSDGAFMGVWLDSEAEAKERADEQTAFHAEAGLSCVFAVRDDSEPKDITFPEAMTLAMQGVDVYGLGEAGLVTINGTSPSTTDDALNALFDDPGYL